LRSQGYNKGGTAARNKRALSRIAQVAMNQVRQQWGVPVPQGTVQQQVVAERVATDAARMKDALVQRVMLEKAQRSVRTTVIDYQQLPKSVVYGPLLGTAPPKPGQQCPTGAPMVAPPQACKCQGPAMPVRQTIPPVADFYFKQPRPAAQPCPQFGQPCPIQPCPHPGQPRPSQSYYVQPCLYPTPKPDMPSAYQPHFWATSNMPAAPRHTAGPLPPPPKAAKPSAPPTAPPGPPRLRTKAKPPEF